MNGWLSRLSLILLVWGLSLAIGNAADPPLMAGNPLPGMTHVEFSGVGGTNTAGGALNALSAFEAAIGGVKNTAASPQTGGFRTITWDGVAVDGTDFGGNSVVISLDKTVGIPINRFLPQGVFFDEIYAVSLDGFKSLNSHVNAANPALFPSFSSPKTFAMFNDNGIGLSFVLPTLTFASPEPAATRGFGAIFFNVRIANTTTIEYFNGTRSLGKFSVPVGTQGQAEFLGELFPAPVVTSVQITCGTEAIFVFNGVMTAGPATDDPSTGHNLAATDDFVYAEPTTATNAQPAITATAGVSFTSLVATFNDPLDPNAVAKNYTGVVDWGDGFISPAIFNANSSGGFDVRGTHTYGAGGKFPVTVKIADLGGAQLTIQNPVIVSGTGQVLNIATRAKVGTGDDVLIAGFVIGSATSTTKVIVRARGPSLTAFGVPGALGDPTLELHDGSGTTIATNDNWKVNDLGGSQQAEVEATNLQPGNDFESALVRTLAPGNYTAIVRGKDNGTGIAIVEVFNLIQ